MSVLACVHCTGFRELKSHRAGPFGEATTVGVKREPSVYKQGSRASLSVDAIVGEGGYAVRQPEQVQAQCLPG